MTSKHQRKSKIVEIGDEQDATAGFTKRVLLSLVFDVTELRETTERLQIKVYTLAKEHGIPVPRIPKLPRVAKKD